MALAKPGDPYVSHKGEIIKAEKTKTNVREFADTTVITVPLAKNFQSKARRSIKELFADAHTQTVLNSVLMYSMLGLTPNEIAQVLNASPTEVQHIIDLPAYQETFEAMFREIISANSQSLQARISAYAANAVANVMDIAGAEIGEDVPAIVKLKANQDILDRSGLASDTLFGKNAQDDSQNSLRIEIVEAQDSKTNININVRGRK